MSGISWRPSKLMQVHAQLTNREFELLLRLKQESGETTTNIVRAALREYAGKVLNGGAT